MQQQELIPHLFRTEFSKITSVLCKSLGLANMEQAEDIASETFLSALEIWPYKGIPPNPAAWLYTVAKNKAQNHIARNNIFDKKIAGQILASSEKAEEIEIDLSDKNITDSQLQMLFAICQPALSTEAQIGLALRILCGFGINEIANALLTNKDTINKRLYRAKEQLRQDKKQIALPQKEEMLARLDNVLLTLYLLFNEGYYSESRDTVLREDLCLEALRLTYMLIENEQTNQPNVNALMGLMCFHASRFAARKGDNGAMILYKDQDESLWDRTLITKGAYYLTQASHGNNISKYHLEAGIAYWHTIKEDTTEKWENILQLFNHLLQIEYTPIAALNRTYAVSKVRGKHQAIAEAEQLQLTGNHYYHILLAELYTGTDNGLAKTHLDTALTLARTSADKTAIKNRICALL